MTLGDQNLHETSSRGVWGWCEVWTRPDRSCTYGGILTNPSKKSVQLSTTLLPLTLVVLSLQEYKAFYSIDQACSTRVRTWTRVHFCWTWTWNPWTWT